MMVVRYLVSRFFSGMWRRWGRLSDFGGWIYPLTGYLGRFWDKGEGGFGGFGL